MVVLMEELFQIQLLNVQHVLAQQEHIGLHLLNVLNAATFALMERQAVIVKHVIALEPISMANFVIIVF